MPEKTQADFRRSYVNVDRFGRRWLVVIEKEHGDPTAGTPQPAGWNDPLGTPAKYVMVPRDQPRAVRILYVRWINDLRLAHREFQRQVEEQGRRMYGEHFTDAMAQKPPQRLRDAVGPAPLDIRFVERAAHGDRGLLGLEELKPKDARRLGQDPEERARQRQLAEELGPLEETGTTTPSADDIVEGYRVKAHPDELPEGTGEEGEEEEDDAAGTAPRAGKPVRRKAGTATA